MTEINRPDRGADDGRARRLRVAIYAGIAVQVLIYLYLFVYIGRHANPKGDGMEWVAIVPATFVLGIGALPALGLGFSRRFLPAGVMLALIGVALNAAFFLEIAREFAESGRR
jgi:hypothetical protein